MLITERQILRNLRRVTSELPECISEKDSRFIIEATNAVVRTLIDAEEPINKTHRYHERARRIAAELQSFIQHRNKEQWSTNSTYTYPSYRLYEITENRIKRSLTHQHH